MKTFEIESENDLLNLFSKKKIDKDNIIIIVKDNIKFKKLEEDKKKYKVRKYSF